MRRDRPAHGFWLCVIVSSLEIGGIGDSLFARLNQTARDETLYALTNQGKQKT